MQLDNEKEDKSVETYKKSVLVTYDDVHSNFATAIKYGRDSRYLDISKLKGFGEDDKAIDDIDEEVM